jgi:hypothetical protein
VSRWQPSGSILEDQIHRETCASDPPVCKFSRLEKKLRRAAARAWKACGLAARSQELLQNMCLYSAQTEQATMSQSLKINIPRVRTTQNKFSSSASQLRFRHPKRASRQPCVPNLRREPALFPLSCATLDCLQRCVVNAAF